MANTGKIAEVFYEAVLENIEDQIGLIDKTTLVEIDDATMQNSNNVTWRPREQQAPIIPGWDLTGMEQEIIEETYPAILGVPKNDFVRQRIDNMRDLQFWKRRGERSAMQQAAELNKTIAGAISTQGSLHYRSSATNGFDFIGEAQAIMNERQGMNTERCFYLNDRDTLAFASDLSGRQTVRGRPEDAWATGQIGSGVAGFDGVYTGSFLPTLAGGTATTTITAAQSFAPEGGSVDEATGTVTNVDYRRANVPVASNASFEVGDKISISNSGTTIKAVGISDKTVTDTTMTFTVVGKPTGMLTISPKPIAINDAALSLTERAYGNVNTTIGNGAVITRLNTDASVRTNLFWDKDAVEVYGGSIPADLFSEFDGNKVIEQTLSNGLSLYMVYDGDITDMTFRYRCFIWYSVTIKDPERVGVATRFTV